MKVVAIVGAALVFVAILITGCGAATPAASPIHQANVFFDGIEHSDFRQACSVVDLYGRTMEWCESYFTVSTAEAGQSHAHAVPHSEKVSADGTKATVHGIGSNGDRYLVSETYKHRCWVLTSVEQQ